MEAEEINGILLNSSFVLDPTKQDCMGKDAVTSPQNNNYSGGQAARVTGPNQEVFRFPSEGYCPIDTFTGNFLFYMIFGGDYVGETFVLEIYRYNPVTGIEEHDPTKDILYSRGSSVGYTVTGKMGYFNQTYMYKFIIRTSDNFGGSYADLDLIQFIRVNKNNIMNWSGYSLDPSFSGNQAWEDYGEVAVPYTTGAYGKIDVNFNVEFAYPPNIQLTAYASSSGYTMALQPQYKNVTTTGFTIYVINPTGETWSGDTTVMWRALGEIAPTAF